MNAITLHAQRNIVAIVPAAGLGKRFGEEKNKPFYPIKDKPLLIWTLEALQNIEEISEIVPVLKEEDLIACGELVEKYNITKVKRIAPGGKERQDSVYNGIKAVDGKTSIVAIHDGARPFIDRDIIRRTIDGLKGYDGAIAAVPVKDTIKEAGSRQSGEDFIVEKTLNRNVLWAVQTPQVFHFNKIKEAYEKASADKYYATDDAALIEHYGGRVKIVMGSYRNIKITTPEDILIAEALLKI
ncbi:MAG TPA: 2-C-methyl-D-erythritol 4-phosphate cytidylyltransferase [Nitrospiraceae bacterium]|nr:MAG: 2-C-methyl-D-erythritol 4-phosphate cytidylyltransferase [Nitrospirae bacterium GWA2_46_11]OGW23691.1 MAG: 2-C-methyl-D-erythritol 4-phosphate cytidylyltransferase [Nitrospirae bacterium GWB2_47_37]HAK89188.1 2-C-methyl-D-erythritol 4-phosphate cytidylyltransferase [Nitrospiraceae bacterium]HCZ11470.1 2-C-methyl-D-erythritol 4-phosphate cytidylyltransferase [Nitrospiraceae bacterium]